MFRKHWVKSPFLRKQGERTCPRSSPEGFRSRSPRGWTAGPRSRGGDSKGLDNTPEHFRMRFKRSRDAKSKVGASRGNERAVLSIWSCRCRDHVFLFKWNFLCVFESPGNSETWSHFYLYNTARSINSPHHFGNQFSNMYQIFIAFDLMILLLRVHAKQAGFNITKSSTKIPIKVQNSPELKSD